VVRVACCMSSYSVFVHNNIVLYLRYVPTVDYRDLSPPTRLAPQPKIGGGAGSQRQALKPPSFESFGDFFRVRQTRQIHHVRFGEFYTRQFPLILWGQPKI